MLDPSDRKLLLECLRPPDGFRFDHAVGTSFSLDLLSLLAVPLAFTFLDWEEEDGTLTADPLALLEAVRRHSDRITMFCQAGEIKLPPAAQRLTAYLEGGVVPVTAPRGGVFHPKTWLVRYVGTDGAVQIRFVCLSRNLTFDRSWDTVLVLDGELADRERAFRENHALAEFIEALPAMANREVDAQRLHRIQSLGSEVRRVRWTLPPNVDSIGFWPLGLVGRQSWPFKKAMAQRPVLAMSPFLSDGLLVRLARERGDTTLISRPDELAKLSPDTLECFTQTFMFDAPVEEQDAAAEDESPELSGLHAKVFIVDDGWDAHVFLGSANATTAAFERNVEFLTELTGKKSHLGIETFLQKGEGKQAALIDFLRPWTAAPVSLSEEEHLRERLEQKVDDLKHKVAAARLVATFSSDSQISFAIALVAERPFPKIAGGRLKCWPSTLRADRAVDLSGKPEVAIAFGNLTLDALTGFFAFEIELSESGQTVAKRFVCAARVEGAPADRLDRLLAAMVRDREQLLRLLWLLLEAQGGVLDPTDPVGLLELSRPWQVESMGGYPIFERILRALAVDRARLKDLGRLIDDLGRSAEGMALIPSGLLALWKAIQSLESEPQR